MDAAALVADKAQALAESAASHDFSRGLWVPAATRARPPRNDGQQYVSEEEAFPNVRPLARPLGNLVQVMLRVPKLQTIAGLEINEPNERQTERDNTQVAKVMALGPLAFRDRNTRELWPEGAWCKEGDYVRVPKFQGDYTVVKYLRTKVITDHITDERRTEDYEDRVVFAQFKDLALLGRYDSVEDALAERGFDP
jgi:hypothetical protein